MPRIIVDIDLPGYTGAEEDDDRLDYIEECRDTIYEAMDSRSLTVKTQELEDWLEDERNK